MQLSFRLDKRPGESHLALDGKKNCSMAWVRCDSAATLLAGMLFSAFALAVDRFVTIGRRTAQFCFKTSKISKPRFIL